MIDETNAADVIALFPKCSVCGQPLEPTEAELDPAHVFRAKHVTCHRAAA